MPIDVRDRLQRALGAQIEIERELGGGGMSHVFLALDHALGRRIVVKVLPPELALGVNADRFKREIQLAATLQHPHIVPLLAAGEAEGLPFYTMPFVEGESLRDGLRRGERLPLRVAVGLLQDVAKALAYAHRHGVVHRDIKPDNVLVSEGAAVVTDFGVAKALHSARATERDDDTGDGALTSVGMSLGTPIYMAPEQAAADPGTDYHADLYAWGVMAYELLAGTPPFPYRTRQRLMVAHLTEPPAPLSAKVPGVPPELEAIVVRCLAKEPAARPADAAALVRALDEVPVMPTSSTTMPAVAAPARPRHWPVVAVGAIVVAAAIVAGVLVVRHAERSAAAPPAPASARR